MDDCLALRQQLKEEFRARLRKESGGGVKDKAPPATTDEKYGGFFGRSSEVVFSDRVIQELQACLRIIPKSASPGQLEVGRKSNKSAAGSKTVRKILDAVKKREKEQWLKNSRDYSFLSSDCDDIPVPGNNKPEISRPVEMTKKEIKGSEIQAMKTTVSKNSRPPVDMVMKGSKIQAAKRVSRPEKTEQVSKNSQNSRPPVDTNTMMKSSKIQAAKRVSRPEKTEQVSKNSSKKPLETTTKKPCLKRKLEQEEDIDAVSLIRKMFRYDPTKFCDEDDKGDLNMEATFDDIQKEERRSTKIAKKEDDEELKKILRIKIKNVKKTTD